MQTMKCQQWCRRSPSRDQLGKQDHRPDCVPRTGPKMV